MKHTSRDIDFYCYLYGTYKLRLINTLLSFEILPKPDIELEERQLGQQLSHSLTGATKELLGSAFFVGT